MPAGQFFHLQGHRLAGLLPVIKVEVIQCLCIIAETLPDKCHPQEHGWRGLSRLVQDLFVQPD